MKTGSMRRAHRALIPVVLTVLFGGAGGGVAAANPSSGAAPSVFSRPPVARPDAYTVRAGRVLRVGSARGLYRNDSGFPLQVVGHTDPAHGSVVINADGSFTYTPATGFSGDDTFTYTETDAVQLSTAHLPSLGTFGGVALNAAGYGSSLYPVPGSRDEFYGLEDRDPNVSAPNGDGVLPLPSFDPAIGKFLLRGGNAILEKTIPLKDANGDPYSGRVNAENSTGETLVDLDGNVLPPDPNGYDSEGLVARRDGTFWVSDEYGPFVTHFSRDGRAIGRLSPFDGTLPAELANRVPNRGMEGLTITPDGRTLVGIMQSSLQQADLSGFNAKKLTPLRIVTVDLRTHAEHEYLYLLDNPAANGTAVSEITALSNTTFLVDERDGSFPGPGVYKKLWAIDIGHATDVGPASTVPGATYDAAHGGLLVGGKSIELLVKNQDTATSEATLGADGITPVTKSLRLDVNGLLLALDPQARFYSHDKIEGVAAVDGGRRLVISNDSDFGIDATANNAPPYLLHEKVSPTTGLQDNGEYLEIDTTRLPARTSTATVTVHVLPL
jgi:hypothetical protein